jgi:hypothetical protein
MPTDQGPFSKIAHALIKNFEANQANSAEKKISVNILVTKLASYYEKIRTAMDYGTEETILRRAIERMLKRITFLETNSKNVAEGLVRELVWAGYFADATVPESITEKVETSIRLYFKLKQVVSEKKLTAGIDLNDYFIQLLSSDIDTILLPNKEKEAMSNFMFFCLRNSVEIVDDSTQTRDAQVFLGIRKNFDKDDVAFLRYKLFIQMFGKLTEDNFQNVANNFGEAIKEIEKQLNYPKKDRIFNHIKKNTPAFLILYDTLMIEKENIYELVKNEEEFKKKVYEICRARYKSVRKKVTTAIIRSFIFILVTKAIIALFLEGAFESLVYGKIQWLSIGLNTTVPPLLMIFVGMLVQTPGDKNSYKIFAEINKLLFDESPQITTNLTIKLKPTSARTIRDQIFSLLWLLSIVLVFGLLIWALTKLYFNPLSQAIFIFFIAIISFLSYRIFQTANAYTVTAKQNILSPIVDFFFVPVIRVGRSFTEGIAQINFILIIIDFIIEAPFKGLVGFFEQWFSFLANKREELE